MKLSDAQYRALSFLQKGQRGFIDQYGRMVSAGVTHPQGSWKSWLVLMAHGLIQGDQGIVTLTEYGMHHLLSGAEKPTAPSKASAEA